jgi:hypothetical protein
LLMENHWPVNEADTDEYRDHQHMSNIPFK